jgi:ABC-type phosphate transport system auxiliary subunit
MSDQGWGKYFGPFVSLGIAFVSAVSVVSTMIEKTNMTADRIDKIETKIDELAHGQCTGIKEALEEVRTELKQILHDHDDVTRQLKIPTRKGEFPEFRTNGG